jgi:hypothetical protein
MAVVLALAVPFSVRADDWPNYQHDPAHTGFSNINMDARQLKLAWTTPAGYHDPVIANGTLYAFNSSAVTAFNLTNGAVEWTTPVTGPQFVAVANGLLVTTSYSFGQSKTLQVLNASTGASKYAVSFGSNQNFPGIPTLYTDPTFGLTALDVDASGTLYSIKVGQTAGSVNWSAPVGSNGGGAPTVVGNSAVVATYSAARAVNLSNGASNLFFQGNFSSAAGFGVAYDANRQQLYFVNTVSSSHPDQLLAYSYQNNSSLTLLWARDITGVANDPAIDQFGDIYLGTGTTLTEYSPINGSTIRSLGGQSFANGTTPELTQGYLFDDSGGQEDIYNLNSLSLVNALGGAPSSQNTSIRSTSAITDGYFALEHQFLTSTDTVSVYAVVPEPTPLAIALLAFPFLLGRRRALPPLQCR